MALQYSDLSIQDRIGRGASGSVYRAVHGVTGKSFAVKVVDLAHIFDNNSVSYERLPEKIKQQHHIVYRELQVLHRHYRSPHLLKTYDAFYFASSLTLNIVMEYMDFGNLEDLGRHFWKKHHQQMVQPSPKVAIARPLGGSPGAISSVLGTSALGSPPPQPSGLLPSAEKLGLSPEIQATSPPQLGNSLGVGTPNSEAPASPQTGKRHPIPERAVCIIGEQVLLALKEMHEQNHIHRDIKPANILVNKKGGVRLSDFGLAEVMTSGTASDGGEEEDIRCSGTNHYMSPERQRGESHGGASDIWALGVTLAECAIGRYPFDIDDCQGPFEVMAVMMQGIDFDKLSSPTDPESSPMKVELTAGFKDFIHKCTAPDPKARPTAAELLLHSVFAQWPGTYDLGIELQDALQGVSLTNRSFMNSMLGSMRRGSTDSSTPSTRNPPASLKALMAEGNAEDQAKEAARQRCKKMTPVKPSIDRNPRR